MVLSLPSTLMGADRDTISSEAVSNCSKTERHTWPLPHSPVHLPGAGAPGEGQRQFQTQLGMGPFHFLKTEGKLSFQPLLFKNVEIRQSFDNRHMHSWYYYKLSF